MYSDIPLSDWALSGSDNQKYLKQYVQSISISGQFGRDNVKSTKRKITFDSVFDPLDCK